MGKGLLLNFTLSVPIRFIIVVDQHCLTNIQTIQFLIISTTITARQPCPKQQKQERLDIEEKIWDTQATEGSRNIWCAKYKLTTSVYKQL